jgi:hypothetical protein
MANIITTYKDHSTGRDTKPDFNTEKSYHWMHMVKSARKAGVANRLPRKPRSNLAEKSFFKTVDERLSRTSFSPGIAFDSNGKIIREES